MTNKEKYSRVRDLVVFVVITNIASWAFYLLGEVTGRTAAENACDQMRAEKIDKLIKSLPTAAPAPGAKKGVF